MKAIARLIALLMLVAASCSAALAQTPEEAQKFSASISALAEKPRAVAYDKFIGLHVIAKPHPEKDVESFIQRARRGDKDAFAFVSMMVWREYAGFRGQQVVGKLALIKAMNDGSALGAYFIAETFVTGGVSNNQARGERYLDSLHWFGVAAGMGESRAHDRALEIIKLLGTNLNEEQRRQLHFLYNKGMEEGVVNRQKPASP